MKPRIREAILVEGRYDKNTLSQAVDAVILESSGFGIFHDREKIDFLRRVAERRGLIIFTDSDGAGFVIRNRLKSILPREKLLHAYIPDVEGKERRKQKPSKAGDNAALNGLAAPRFQAVTGNVIGDRAMMEQLSRQPYDIVLANIVADVIIPLSSVVPRFLKPDGVFICSGILSTRLPEVVTALESAGLSVLRREEQDDWCCLTAVLK